MNIFHVPAQPGRDNDFSDVPSLLAAMTKAMSQGAQVWVKWTCPACGERGISDVPNIFHSLGADHSRGDYIHTEKKDGTPCGAVYQGQRFGFGMALPIPTPEHPAHKAGGN